MNNIIKSYIINFILPIYKLLGHDGEINYKNRSTFS